jgi:hypothetical protein
LQRIIKDAPAEMERWLHTNKMVQQNLLNSTNTPRAIELSFRKELGIINPQLCLMDVAMSFFSTNLENSNNKSRFLRKEASRHGHPSLYTDHLIFDDSRRVGYVAMLALIQSKADAFCTTIQNHPCLGQNYKSLAKGDFLRKTIYVVIKSSHPNVSPSNPVEPNDIAGILDNNNLLLIDYYRSIRNDKLHSSSTRGTNANLLKLYEQIDLDMTKKEFKLIPHHSGIIDIKDIILFSKVWQKVAKDIARSFIDLNKYVVCDLKKKFGNLKFQRRDNAVKQYLSREFLLDNYKISVLVNNLWAG